MTIYDEIAAEREYQDRKWGGGEADDANNCWHDWVVYIAKYSTGWLRRGKPNPEAFRKSMIMVAALAVAAIEQTDRLYPAETVKGDGD